MNIESPYRIFKRYRTLQTDRIGSLPIVILMPHSSCNCRCVMCDIWKGNHELKQLNEADVAGLMATLRDYGTSQVLMTGGEALLSTNFFKFCEILKQNHIRISLHSSGLTLKRNAKQLAEWVDDIIVSLDGPEFLHDQIRNIPGAFKKMKEGIDALRIIQPQFGISGRTVIQQLNFRSWPGIIEAAREIGLDTISFLPADLTSKAFNRTVEWSVERKEEIVPAADELREMKEIIETIAVQHKVDFANHFIAESVDKLRKIHQYYAAYYGIGEFPYKKCNAPWVSTVIESDGSVRPCFFHQAYGNIKTASLDKIINSPEAIRFRKTLDTNKNETCLKCVCYLNLKPATRI
jgi:MoaA/NifB/PqqE/SkfB family radical SAM enzyme